MISNDLEFLISQYLDGTLSAAERSALQARVESDADARAMLEEYQRIDRSLKSMPMPPVAWEALAASIASGIDAADEEAARRYRLPSWIRSVANPLAIAASLLIVAGVGIELYRTHRPAGRSNPAAVAIQTPGLRPSAAPGLTPGSATVLAFMSDRPSGPVQEDIAVGPGAESKDDPIVVQYSDSALVSRPSHVAVASGVVPVQDTQPMSAYDMQ